MRAKSSRSGFTLVEIILVLGIVVLLASLLVPVTLRMQDRSNIPQGIKTLEQAIFEAKARAKYEKRPQGIRLLPMDNQRRQLANGTFVRWYDRIQFIEDPGPFSEGFIWAWVTDPVPGPGTGAPQTKYMRMPLWQTGGSDTYAGAHPPTEVRQVDISYLSTIAAPAARPNVVFGPFESVPSNAAGTTAIGGRKQVNPFSFGGPAGLQQFVEPGDFLEIKGIGQLYRITQIASSSQLPPGLGNPLRPSRLVLDRNLPFDIQPPLHGYPNYKIHRAPRVVPRKPIIPLPRECIIDLQPPAAATSASPNVFPGAADRDAAGALWIRGVSRGIPLSFLPPAAQNAANTGVPIDLMFSPTGELVRPAGQANPEDIVYLWMHTYGNPDAWQSGNPTAAGGNVDNQALVVIYARTGQVASFPVNQVFAGPPGDPWLEAKRGRAQGMGGM